MNRHVNSYKSTNVGIASSSSHGSVFTVKALDADAHEHLFVNMGSFVSGIVILRLLFGLTLHYWVQEHPKRKLT